MSSRTSGKTVAPAGADTGAEHGKEGDMRQYLKKPEGYGEYRDLFTRQDEE
ncbi:hypothetical protein [Actinophytocola sp.]|uniref:hypothetical protein n=1 Tax=Actinophytocola sp. TaxID=1872138 RepID=UPI0025C2C6AC|nr:hypothetical protein [Actinophytocola sp.]